MLPLVIIFTVLTIFAILLTAFLCLDPTATGELAATSAAATIVLLICTILFVKSLQKEQGFQTRQSLDTLIETCEANLPRSQHCTLVAIPNKK